jgi:uncharacterized NAD-dependent epimerase/dehydratase family protein
MSSPTTATPAVVYCEDGLSRATGKTAHGLLRFTQRYDVVAVVDSTHAGRAVADVVYGARSSAPIVESLERALQLSAMAPTHLVIGLAPDGGLLTAHARNTVIEAIRAGLNVVAGLHSFLNDDAELSRLADARGVSLHDVRRPPNRNELHAFDGRIEEVKAFRVAVLGTDSAVGKRTTARLLVEALQRAGFSAQMLGTGQTAWLEGWPYGIVLDALVNDFVAGEIEHAIWRCDQETNPDVIVIEGQGSLMNPAYPGGSEILAAGRPHVVVLQHAPARRDYDGFCGFRIQPLARQVAAIELIGGRPVVAIAVNHQGLELDQIVPTCRALESVIGVPACDPLVEGIERVLAAVVTAMPSRARATREQPRTTARNP